MYKDLKSQFELFESLSKGNQIVFTGAPCIGKSIFLKCYFTEGYDKRPQRKILFWLTSSILKRKSAPDLFQLYRQLIKGTFSKSCHVILFIDGADEIFPQNCKDIEKLKNLLLNCQKKKITVIISCRENYYERNLSDLSFSHNYKISRWDDSQIMDYACLYLDDKKSFSQFKKYYEKNSEIKEFLQNPFQLALLLCLFSDAKENNKNMYRSFRGGNTYLLYDRFYREWLNRELKEETNQHELAEKICTVHQRIAITLFKRYNNPMLLDKILTKKQIESGICYENAMKDFLNTEIENGNCIVTGFWHSTYLEYLISRYLISAFLSGGNVIIKLFEKNVFRHFDMDFVELGFKSLPEYQLYQISKNLEDIYYNIIFADNDKLIDDIKVVPQLFSKSKKIDIKKRYVVRDQVVFFIGKLPSNIVKKNTVIRYAYENERDILVKISAATVSINHGIYFDIEKDFINKLLYDQLWDRILRSWVVIYWGDVKNSDPYNYIDTGGEWERIKQRRLQRLVSSGVKSKKYINTRLIDLTQLYIFYRSRGWETLTQEEYSIIANCSTASSQYSCEKRELIEKVKNMFALKFLKNNTGT